ncbi:unnamed protein product [Cylindrotheca closterium]|uniref:Uncharacterized protein n=1 Tax=Cylindrotheca closterium TaxID=2856 RepID=A0AAD2G6I0_9STRA|nr:unnamed protein product [Cylindrotheca closterium]
MEDDDHYSNSKDYQDDVQDHKKADASSPDHELVDDGSITATISTTTTTTTTSTKSGKRRKRKKKLSMDDLKRKVSELMQIFEEHGIFVPPPESTNGQKNKVWSNRNYGADKKRQRKNAERELIEARIVQLESCLKSDHGLLLSTTLNVEFDQDT